MRVRGHNYKSRVAGSIYDIDCTIKCNTVTISCQLTKGTILADGESIVGSLKMLLVWLVV